MQNGHCASSHHIHVLGRKEESRGKRLLPHETLSSYVGREILLVSLTLPSHESQHSHLSTLKPISSQGEWDDLIMTCYDQPGSILWAEDESRNKPSLRLRNLILPMKKNQGSDQWKWCPVQQAKQNKTKPNSSRCQWGRSGCTQSKPFQLYHSLLQPNYGTIAGPRWERGVTWVLLFTPHTASRKYIPKHQKEV